MIRMTLAPCRDSTAADWITTSRQWWWHLVTVGPQTFSAYARLRFIPDPAYPGQSENDMGRPPGVLDDVEQLRVAVDTLLPRTSAPEDGYLLLWDGWDDSQFPQRLRGGAQVQIGSGAKIPERNYWLCRVSLLDFVSGAAEEAWRTEAQVAMPPPAFIWPADRAWCITHDVDPHWAVIGADPAAIDALLTEPRLDIVAMAPNEEPPHFS